MDAISRLVTSGDLQRGFMRMRQLGLLDWTVEGAVMRFPDEFPSQVREAAAWRLSQARPKEKKPKPAKAKSTPPT